MRYRRLIPFLMLGILAFGRSPSSVLAQEVDLHQLLIPELNLQNTTLQEALGIILENTQVSVVIPAFAAGQDSIRIVRMRLRNISVADALREVLEPRGLAWSVEGAILRIYPDIVELTIRYRYLAARFAPLMTGGAAGGRAGGAAAGGAVGGTTGGAPGGTGMGIQEFEQQLRSMLSGEQATLLIDQENHTIHVEDYRQNVTRIARYIELIDKPTRQVMIQVRLVEIVHTGDTAFGVGYRMDLTGSSEVASAMAELPLSVGSGDFLIDLQQFRLGGLYGGNLDLDAAVRALATVSRANLLSKPATVVLDGRQASISLTDQIPYTETLFGTGTVATTTSFIDVGIMLNVMPTVLDSNNVQLQINVQFSTAPTISPTGVPVVSQRSAFSPVVVNDGQFFVMAGLVREDESVTESGIPILRSLPLLKYLFSTTTRRTEKRELLIFVEPTIINPDDTGESGA